MNFDTIDKVKFYLESLPKFQTQGKEGANFDLARFKNFCVSINNPQDRLATVHVGGTNGKGSTCRLLAAVYECAGYKTGLYTSPHLISFNERLQINGRNIPDDKLVLFFSNYAEQILQHRLTYFEISTAAAFWWFENEKVDLSLIEVGLGGRLDATNVVNPLLSVITSVALDHTDILGHSLKEIAREKAGIIKPGKPVVIGNLPEEAEKVITETAERRNSTVIKIEDLRPKYLGNGRFQLTEGLNKMVINTDLLAPVQAINISLCRQVVKQLDRNFPVNSTQFQEGIRNAGKRYPHTGGFNRLRPDRLWFFDGGHNIEAVRAMKETIRTIKPVNEAIAVLCLMRDKINKELITEFLEFKKIYYHELNTDRAATLTEVKKWLPDVRSFPAVESQKQSLLKDLESELVIFAGSFYFYAAVRDWLNIITHYR